jgi:hypothetical protein
MAQSLGKEERMRSLIGRKKSNKSEWRQAEKYLCLIGLSVTLWNKNIKLQKIFAISD